VGVADPELSAAAVKAGRGLPYSAHNPNFVVNLRVIPVGTKVATVSMLDLLAERFIEKLADPSQRVRKAVFANYGERLSL
jgi:hypothetical protein